jgi:hypothetical protein
MQEWLAIMRTPDDKFAAMRIESDDRAKLGRWQTNVLATVIYTTVEPIHERVSPRMFACTGTEFIEKFRYVRSH